MRERREEKIESERARTRAHRIMSNEIFYYIFKRNDLILHFRKIPRIFYIQCIMYVTRHTVEDKYCVYF